MTASKATFWILPLLAIVSVTTPAVAQTAAPLDLRVGKLEKEMRAVQRTVFPQGLPVEPELSAPAQPAGQAGSAATSPITDLTSRVDALEKQVASLTGSSEQNDFRIKQLEATLATIQSRLTALEGGQPTAAETGTGGPPTSLATETPTAAQPIRTGPATVKVVPTLPPQTPSKAAPTKADPARKAAVAAIEMPATGDAAEDDYTYGFRLYTAKLYPEAQTKLKAFTEKYPPTVKRWSYAKNLLGRAYLDEGKPALASVAFYDNYQKAPRGERAADSLTWLGQSLIRLKKMPDACKVFDELDDVYVGKLTADQKARAAKGRADAKCAN